MKSNIIDIDKEKCIGCGLCVKDCPSKCISLENGKATYNSDLCIKCGHCFAICPKSAIDMPQYDTNNLDKYYTMENFDSENLLSAFKSRRTIRQFKTAPIEKEKIRMILEAGRYCQTAKNVQGINFTILDSKKELIESICVKMFRRAISVGKIFSKSLKNYNIDDNFFFKKAPTVIIVSGRENMNKGLATSYMELMAESLGLGVLVSGFTETCIRLNPRLKRMINLPKGHKIYSVMVIGYPDVKYQRIVPRDHVNFKVL